MHCVPRRSLGTRACVDMDLRKTSAQVPSPRASGERGRVRGSKAEMLSTVGRADHALRSQAGAWERDGLAQMFVRKEEIRCTNSTVNF
jgi:hypothetical protein